MNIYVCTSECGSNTRKRFWCKGGGNSGPREAGERVRFFIISMRRLTILAFCGAATVCCWGQNQTPKGNPVPKKSSGVTADKAVHRNAADRHLVLVQNLQTQETSAGEFYPPLKCDADGNIYIQNDPTSPGVRKLNPKGERVRDFRATSTDLRVDVAPYFNVSGDGELYELVYAHEVTSRYVFTYGSDGTLNSQIKLDPGFVWMPHFVAAFPSGQLLVSGSEHSRDEGAPVWAFTAVFSSDGRLLKEIKLEDDDALHKMAESGDARITSPSIPESNTAIDYGNLEMGADGNAYLMRATNPAIIYAISAGGEVVWRFSIEPGDANYRPMSMHLSQQRIAVMFFDEATHDKLIKIVDLEGHDVATYDELRAHGQPVNHMLGLAFTCYMTNPERFIFLGSGENSRLELWIAEPQ